MLHQKLDVLFEKHLPLFYCLCFIAVIVWLNITADWSFQNLILEQLYNITEASIAPTKAQCAALVGADADEHNGSTPECAGLFYLLLAGKLSANTTILKILNVVFIIASVLTAYQFYRIYRSHAPSRIEVGLCIGIVAVCYYLHSLGVFWTFAPSHLNEGHFTRVSATLPAEALQTFCRIKVGVLERSDGSVTRGDAAAMQSFKEKHKNRFDPKLTENNILCPQGIEQVRILFVFSLLAGIVVVSLAMGAGSVGFNQLTRPSSDLLAERQLEDRPLTSTEDLLVEYRKRFEDARNLLYFGSSILVLGIAWMAAHAKWASPILLVVWGTDSFAMINGYITYLVILYLTFVIGAYVPQALFLQHSLRLHYHQSLVNDPSLPSLPFTKWLNDNKIDPSIVGVKDFVALVAPIASLILSGLLESSSIATIAGAIGRN
jgi:hypothetical protein